MMTLAERLHRRQNALILELLGLSKRLEQDPKRSICLHSGSE